MQHVVIYFTEMCQVLFAKFSLFQKKSFQRRKFVFCQLILFLTKYESLINFQKGIYVEKGFMNVHIS